MTTIDGRRAARRWRLRALLPAVPIGVALICAPEAVEAQTIGEVFRKVNPTVVVIRAKGRDVEGAGGLTRFNETGSGVLISTDGKVLTAAHVVHSMDEINVEFLGGETVPARVISSEPAADLSLLRLERVPKGVMVAPLADSDTVRVGDPVMVIGAPYGLSHSMSAGWISARWPANSVYRPMPLAEFLQTNATINTGNSGGPMFNMAGEVIGIVSHNISKSGGSEGLGFVVSINTAKKLLLERPSFWSGLEGRLVTGPIAQILNLPQASGYLVKSVARGSVGDAVGLRGGTVPATIMGEQMVVGGDIILKVHGTPVGEVTEHRRVRDLLDSLPPGAEFTMTVLRLGQVIELKGRHP
ncbi:MAG TPA: trypsin-like peptidase domain-containing protein [Candidatus Nitrosotalea sp.]|nr:trypsin-like peptidase domain-containing protein [Candidatus Nitrosotalea sp.]